MAIVTNERNDKTAKIIIDVLQKKWVNIVFMKSFDETNGHYKILCVAKYEDKEIPQNILNRISDDSQVIRFTLAVQSIK